MTLIERYKPLFSPDDGGGASPSPPAPASPAPDTAAGTPSPSSPDTKVSGETANEVSQPVDFGESGSFEAFNSQDDLDEIVLPTDTGPREGDGGEAKPAPAAGKEKEPAKAAAAPSPQPQPEAKPPPPASPAESLPLSTPDQILQGLEAEGAAAPLLDWLAGNVYKLSDAERQALDTDAVGAIPRIMSRVHLEATKNTLKLLSSLVPQMIESGVRNITQSQQKGQEALNEFFSAWPSIAREHTPLVDQYAKAYRQMNPKASRKDAIAFVGSAISAQLGLPAPQPGVQPGSNGAAPPARRAAAPPFAPARPGARQISTAVVPDSPWMGLGEDHEED
jgi:hypothetical protein